MNMEELVETVRRHEARLNAIDVAYAKIEVKLNLILAILAGIGTALAGVLVKMIF